ncbi:MAG: cytochrome C oxidase subunit IV family protein [Candidatus Eremiobacteraeota bacterium]|nr:cytochrome C oxidase subunit IV family protein [Candidatus Eremiobacteraeota bacterium]
MNTIAYLVLMGLLALTVGLSYLDLGRFGALAAAVIAVAKTGVVATIFMHLRKSTTLVRLLASGVLLWLLLLFGLTLSDYFTRGG